MLKTPDTFIFIRVIATLFSILLFGDAIAQRLPDEVVISAELSDVSIDSALLILSTASGVNISYDPKILPKESQRSLSVDRLKLGIVLDDVLYNTGLIYRIVGNQLIIVKKPFLKSDPKVRLSGHVYDAKSGERLVYANIFSQESSIGGLTNEYGYFSLLLPQGEHVIHFSYLGYSESVIVVQITKDTIIDIALSVDNQLNEVVIVEDLTRSIQSPLTSNNIPVEMLNSMPALGGEPDLFRMLQMRAGVSSGADGLGGINIRGGETDQNLILLDGVPVYNTGHALGLFSVFNSSVIKSATLYKDGFPARFGGRLSSVMDVRIKEGNRNELQGDFSVSPFLIRGSLEGPIKKGSSSFLVSARRTIVDPWLRPLSKYQFELNDEEGFVDYHFYDINAKMNFFIGDKDELYLSAFAGNDLFENEVLGTVGTAGGTSDIEELDVTSREWGNEVLSLRWGHYFNRKFVAYFNAGFSEFSFQNFDFDRTRSDVGKPEEDLIYDAQLFQSRIRTLIGNIDFNYFVSGQYSLRFGANRSQHILNPAISFNTSRDDILNSALRLTPDAIENVADGAEITGAENRFYIENDVNIGALSANLGVHGSLITTENRDYWTVQPRVDIRLSLSEASYLRAAYSQIDQYMHLLSSSGYGLPNDIWLPSTDEVAPQRSESFSFGLSGAIGAKASISLNGFYKRFINLRSLIDGGFLSIKNNGEWSEGVPSGSGDVVGFEIEMDKRIGSFKGWINYTYSKSNRIFESINNGESFLASNNRSHMFKLNSLYQLNENLEFALSWQMASGLPYTSPVGINEVRIDGKTIYLPIYGGINNITLPVMHRMDFAINLYTKYNWGQQKISFGAYNTYNRQNPFYIDVVRNPETNAFESEAVSILPFIPFVSISIAF